MSLIQDKQAKIVNGLYKSTQRGKIKWLPFEDEPGCVTAEISDKQVYINEYHSNDTDSVKLEIYANGVLADSFIDDELSSSEVESVTNEGWFLTMTSLLENARRKSTGADEVLDSLLKDLGE